MKRIHFLLIILVIAISWFFFDELTLKDEGPNQQGVAKTNWLVKKYGLKLYSQNDEELIIWDFSRTRETGLLSMSVQITIESTARPIIWRSSWAALVLIFFPLTSNLQSRRPWRDLTSRNTGLLLSVSRPIRKFATKFCSIFPRMVTDSLKNIKVWIPSISTSRRERTKPSRSLSIHRSECPS